MTTFADILTYALFFICRAATGAAALQAFPHTALQRSDWTAGEPISSGAAGYLNSPHRAQLNQTTSSDSSNIILLKEFIPIKCAQSQWAQTEEDGTPFLKNYLHPKCIRNGKLLHLLTAGSLLMHLLIEGGNSLRFTMNKVAVMKSDMQLHLEGNGRAEESSRLDCVDLPRSSLTERENTNLLHCQDTAEHSSPIKYRRYGYALFLSLKYYNHVMMDSLIG